MDHSPTQPGIHFSAIISIYHQICSFDSKGTASYNDFSFTFFKSNIGGHFNLPKKSS